MKQFFCVFSIEGSKVYFVHSYDSKSDADVMCESMNNFSNDLPCRFIVRCLDQSDYEAIFMFLIDNPHKDISSVYYPFITRIFVRA